MCKGVGAQTSLYEGYLDLEITALLKHNVPLAGKSGVKLKERFPLARNNHFLCTYFFCNAGERRELRATRRELITESCRPRSSLAVAEVCNSRRFASAAIQSLGRETDYSARRRF